MTYQYRSRILGLALLLACGVLSAVAQSAEPPTRGPMTFEAFDGDGRVSPEEFATHQVEHRRQMMRP